MTATLEQLVQVRSLLAEEVLAYLDGLAERLAELPKYYPAHLRAAAAGKTPFDDIRQMVQVVEDRSAFERWLAEERERMRAAGQDFDRIAYKPKRSLMEEEESDERDRTDRDRPAPPPPFQWDENAGSRFKRAVILGDPGFGKTWLLRYEARRLARAAAEQLRNRLCDPDQITLPIFIRLSELNQSDNPVEDTLVEAVSAGRSAAFRHFVREKLATERCVILLDAWDEVPIEVPPKGQPIAFSPHHRQRLGQRLDAFARQFTRPRLLLTSRIVGYDKSPIPDLPGQEQVKELELLAFDTPQIESFVRVWFGDDHDARNQFLAMLRQNHQVRGLARTPLMLVLMCRAWVESQEKKQDFPARRVELYDRCLRGLLRDWKIDDKGHAAIDKYVSEAYVDAMIELLQAISYELFAEGYEQFNESSLRAKMIPWLGTVKSNHELYGRDAASLIAELKRDGIFITAGEHHHAPLLFLHRTFQEYLAASALAEREEVAGWQAIEAFVSKKAWLPEWQEVIILLVGKLKNPALLLEMLANPAPTSTNPHGDDLFRHRLVLAALCLPEIRNQQAELVDGITAAVFSLWWRQSKKHTGRAALPLNRALTVLGQLDGRIESKTLLDWIWQHLESKDVMEWGWAFSALTAIGSTGMVPSITDRLTEMLKEANQRPSALSLIRRIGSAAATNAILEQLAQLLPDSEWALRGVILDTLGDIGSAAARPIILDQLAQLLMDSDWQLRKEAMKVVRIMGRIAATPAIINRLTCLLLPEGSVKEAAETVRELGSTTIDAILDPLMHMSQKGYAFAGDFLLHAEPYKMAKAISSIGSAAATDAVLDHLACLLGDSNRKVRKAATEALGGLCHAAARPDILRQLAQLLQDSDSWVRFSAADAIGNIGSAAAIPAVLDQLTQMLQASDCGMRRAAVKAIGDIGSEAATDVILNELTKLLQNREGRLLNEEETVMFSNDGPYFLRPSTLPNWDYELRKAATTAIGKIGKAAATPDVLDELAQMLQNPEWGVSYEAAVAIGKIESATVNDPNLGQLIPQHSNKRIRRMVADSIGSIDSAAVTNAALARLAQLLQDTDAYVQESAIEAVRKLGRAAATPLILDQLAQMLKQSSCAAAKAVEAIGSAAATPAIISELTRMLRGWSTSEREAVAKAVGSIWSVADTDAVPNQLIRLLRSRDSDSRSAAAEALGVMMSKGVRFFRRKWWKKGMVDVKRLEVLAN